MKHFVLGMKAYHLLEKTHHVCINEEGNVTTKNSPFARYYIFLDENLKRWMYYRFTKQKDPIGDFVFKEPPGTCIVRAGFDQVSKFNVW